jgi:hypothetical protein
VDFYPAPFFKFLFVKKFFDATHMKICPLPVLNYNGNRHLKLLRGCNYSFKLGFS